MKKVIVSVINDLATDQRVDKTCTLLTDLGFDVSLVGRVKKGSPSLVRRNYKMHRMRLIFEKGPLFYAEFNLRLFFYLLFHKFDLLVSNDLDTLLPNFLSHRIKRRPLVYDSHELFTETPEVINRPFVKNTWLKIETSIFPKLNDVITVSDSIADIFEKKYNIPVRVVRNVPPLRNFEYKKSRKELDLPENKKILILQGAGINIQRGAEELIESLKFLNNYILLIIGGGDVIQDLKELSVKMNLTEKVRFIPRVPIEELYQYSMNSDLGISIDKDTNLNYRFSLPNKLFDYIHSGIPVLVSPLVEVSKIVNNYQIGVIIKNHEPQQIAKKIKEALSDEKQLEQWKENLNFARDKLNWDTEKKILENIYRKYA